MAHPRGSHRAGVLFTLTTALAAVLVSSSPVLSPVFPHRGLQHIPGHSLPVKSTQLISSPSTSTETMASGPTSGSMCPASTTVTTTITVSTSPTPSAGTPSAVTSAATASSVGTPSVAPPSTAVLPTTATASLSTPTESSPVSTSSVSVSLVSILPVSGSTASASSPLTASLASSTTVPTTVATSTVSILAKSASSLFAPNSVTPIANTTYPVSSSTESSLQPSTTLSAAPTSNQTSCNTATDRQCWTSGFDIDTDYEASTPVTGVTRTYTLVLSEVDNYVSGDGQVKTKAMLVNGSFPGPTITANWGDLINVTVINNLVTNGTSIHWHGIRQLNTNNEDGTNGVTECPMPPAGGSKTYSFKATQYGSSWYHSHFSDQYANGVVGPIVIHGPASANYDIDLGPLMISDWYYGAADQILERVSSLNNSYIPGLPGAAPTSDNVLFNGLNVNVNGTGGEYESLTLTPGKKHLLRLINPSVENTFTVSLVGHSFTIVATDFVPIEPVNVTSVYMAVGQRYDVVIEANQATGSYWFNATLPSGPCGQSYNSYPAAILSYAGANSTTPTSTGSAPPDPSCADSLALYTPVVSRSATVSDFSPDTDDTLTTNIAYESNGVARVFWPVNGSPINVSWNDPTLAYVRDNRTSQLPTDENVISVPKANVTTFWLLENNSSIPHPVHLHGHDVLILGASTPLADPLSGNHTLRSYNPSTDAAKLNGNNPTRRDTTMLPAWGWLVVAFKTNNPGSWLFHCHLAWHVSQGFAVQFLEQLNAIPQSVDLSGLADQCQNWNNYYPAEDPFLKTDSGL